MASGGTYTDEFSPLHSQGNAAFIVNIESSGENGDFEFQTRRGAIEDDGNLQTVFIENFGLKWINPTAYWHLNLPLCRWDHRKNNAEQKVNPKECCLRCHIQSLDCSGSNCFVLAISSHGRELTETEIIFSDGRSLYLTEIFDALNDENCPTLKGIPRIIILQACRSNFEDKEKVQKMQDRGCILNVEISGMPAEGDGGDKAKEESVTEGSGTDMADCQQMMGRFTVETTEDFTFQQIAINKMPENFLLVYPAVSGQRSQRSEEYGSWLIHGLKKILIEKYVTTSGQPKRVNFQHLLTDVSGSIARERQTITHQREDGTGTFKTDECGNKLVDEARSGLKNTVCSHHRLVRPLIFYPKAKGKVDLPAFDFTAKKKRKGNSGLN